MSDVCDFVAHPEKPSSWTVTLVTSRDTTADAADCLTDDVTFNLHRCVTSAL